MVDFFIRRPIFATVSALLMLLIGGICAVRLPIPQYPQIAPPQVQVTTTYTCADVLKRINGVSDANVLGRKYAMRIWIDPDRLANMKIAPTEVIQAIQQENVQAAAGKIGSRPVPTGQDFELPITVKGRLEKASEFEEIIVRRGDDGSIVRIKDVARVELSSENFESAAYIDGKPAGGILIYQYADANALGIIHTVREEMDHLKASFPEGLDYTIVYNTTDYVDENIKEVEHTLIES